MMSLRRISIVALSVLAVSRAFAFDPSLADALVAADPVVRKDAYEKAVRLSDPDKINLAPFISDRLDDPVVGERAAMALCKLGDIGVPYLDRHARSSVPGAEYAAMGLLAGDEYGQEAFAGILRDGDEPSVLRALEVVRSSTMMPAVVATEVQRLADDTDLHFAKPARAAIDAVEKARADKSGGKDAAGLAAELARLSAGKPSPAQTMSSEEAMAALIAELKSSGPAGQQALSDALSAGSIDKATYDQIEALLGVSPSTTASQAGSGGEMKTWQPDTTNYKTRQSAADAFSKNH